MDSPYVGIFAFNRVDSDWFFGRDADVALVLGTCLGSRVTVLYGESGTGKTSLINAGLLPLFSPRPKTRDTSDRYNPLLTYDPDRRVLPVVFDTWQSADFLVSLKVAIRNAVEAHIRNKSEAPVDAGTLREIERAIDQNAGLDDLVDILGSETDGIALLLIFDQFDEYLLYSDGWPKEAEQFEREFARVVNSQTTACHFLVAIREDALARLDRFDLRIKGFFSNLYRLEHLDVQSAIDAIQGPLIEYARQHPSELEISIDDAEVNFIIGELAAAYAARHRLLSALAGTDSEHMQNSQRVEAILLQILLERLWRIARDKKQKKMTTSSLPGKDPVNTVIRSHIEAAIASLPSKSEREIASVVLPAMVLGSGQKVARTLEELKEDVAQELSASWREGVQDCLNRLSRRDTPATRLVREVSVVKSQSQSLYELHHDVLGKSIREWGLEERERRQLSRLRKRWFLRFAFGVVLLAAIGAVIGSRVTERAREQAREQANQKVIESEKSLLRGVAGLSSALLQGDLELGVNVAEQINLSLPNEPSGSLEKPLKMFNQRVEDIVREVPNVVPLRRVSMDLRTGADFVQARDGLVAHYGVTGLDWWPSNQLGNKNVKFHIDPPTQRTSKALTLALSEGGRALVVLEGGEAFERTLKTPLESAADGWEIVSLGSESNAVPSGYQGTASASAYCGDDLAVVGSTEGSLVFLQRVNGKLEKVRTDNIPPERSDNPRQVTAYAYVTSIICDYAHQKWSVHAADSLGRITTVSATEIASIPTSKLVTLQVTTSAIRALAYRQGQVLAATAAGKLIGVSSENEEDPTKTGEYPLLYSMPGEITSVGTSDEDLVALGSSLGVIEVVRIGVSRDTSPERTEGETKDAQVLIRDAYRGAVIFTGVLPRGIVRNPPFSDALAGDLELFAAGNDGIKVWSLPPTSTTWVNDLAFSPVPTSSGGVLAAAKGSTVLLYHYNDRGTLSYQCSWSIPSTEGGIAQKGNRAPRLVAHRNASRLAFDPTGKSLAVGTWNSSIYLLNVAKCSDPKAIHLPGNVQVRGLAVTKDRLAVALDNGNVRVMDRDGEHPHLVAQFGRQATDVVYATNGALLSSSRDRRLLRLNKNQLKSTSDDFFLPTVLSSTVVSSPKDCKRDVLGPLNALSISNQSKLLIGSTDGAIALYSLSAATSSDHKGCTNADGARVDASGLTGIARLNWSMDGRYFGIAAAPGRAQVWRINDWACERVGDFTYPNIITSITFSPDDKFVAFGGHDGIVNLELNPGELTLSRVESLVTRALSPEECKEYTGKENCAPGASSMRQ
jgi:WD40 repeat protein